MSERALEHVLDNALFSVLLNFFGVKFMDSLKLIISMITIVILKTQHDDRTIVFSNSVLELR